MSQLTGTVLAMTIAIILLLGKLLVPQSVWAINISGTSGDDLLTGSSGSSSNQILENNSTGTPNIRNDNQVQADDFIYGAYGNDIIYGLNGSDHLSGGPGNDVIYGGNGSDFIQGGPGNDKLYGGDGNDQIVGGPGADLFDCGPGNRDVVEDYNASEGDIYLPNCEMIQEDND
jgi:Ca2+-binding RTX toxin-like protein